MMKYCILEERRLPKMLKTVAGVGYEEEMRTNFVKKTLWLRVDMLAVKLLALNFLWKASVVPRL